MLELTTLSFVDVHRAVVAALPRIVQCPEDAPEASQLFILKGYRIPFQNISAVLTGWALSFARSLADGWQTQIWGATLKP